MNEIQLAVAKIKPFVAMDEDAMKALSKLESEAMKSYQASSKQVWAINNYCSNNSKELSELIEESGVTVQNPLRLSKTEASSLISFMNKK